MHVALILAVFKLPAFSARSVQNIVCARWLVQPSPQLWPRTKAATTAGQPRQSNMSRSHPCSWAPNDLTWLAVVCARWLEQPSPWLWPRAEVTAGQAEPDREGILSRFGPHCGPPGRLHWVHPGLLAAALITCQGSLEVCQHPDPCLKLLASSACITVLRIAGGRNQGRCSCKEKNEQSACDSTSTCSFFGKA